MPILTLHRKQPFKFAIPYIILINKQPIGIMQKKEISIPLFPGSYNISIKIIGKLWKWTFYIGGESNITINEHQHLNLTVTNKERGWNMLFNIDFFLWCGSLFYTLPQPWNIIYEILSNIFFAVWIIRLWVIRKRYFILKEIKQTPAKNKKRLGTSE